MPPMNLPWSLLGRPVKPVALGLLVTMATIAAVSFTDDTMLGDTGLSVGLGVIATVTAWALVAAWLARSQNAAEVGLLMSFFVWGAALGVFLLAPHKEPLHIGIACGLIVISGGSFLLEVADRLTGTRPAGWGRS